jgi:hypothetical protein
VSRAGLTVPLLYWRGGYAAIDSAASRADVADA